MLPIGIGFVGVLLTFFILFVVMLLLSPVVDFLWPAQYPSSNLARNAYGVLRWAVPAFGVLINLIVIVGLSRQG